MSLYKMNPIPAAPSGRKKLPPIVDDRLFERVVIEDNLAGPSIGARPVGGAEDEFVFLGTAEDFAEMFEESPESPNQ